MNSELTEKSYRYKTDENNYKPTKHQGIRVCKVILFANEIWDIPIY